MTRRPGGLVLEPRCLNDALLAGDRLAECRWSVMNQAQHPWTSTPAATGRAPTTAAPTSRPFYRGTKSALEAGPSSFLAPAPTPSRAGRPTTPTSPRSWRQPPGGPSWPPLAGTPTGSERAVEATSRADCLRAGSLQRVTLAVTVGVGDGQQGSMRAVSRCAGALRRHGPLQPGAASPRAAAPSPPAYRPS